VHLGVSAKRIMDRPETSFPSGQVLPKWATASDIQNSMDSEEAARSRQRNRLTSTATPSCLRADRGWKSFRSRGRARLLPSWMVAMARDTAKRRTSAQRQLSLAAQRYSYLGRCCYVESRTAIQGPIDGVIDAAAMPTVNIVIIFRSYILQHHRVKRIVVPSSQPVELLAPLCVSSANEGKGGGDFGKATTTSLGRHHPHLLCGIRKEPINVEGVLALDFTPLHSPSRNFLDPQRERHTQSKRPEGKERL